MHQPEKKSPTAYHDWSSRGTSTIVSSYKFSTPSILDPVDNLIDSETLNAKALKEKGIDTMVEEARKSTASESDADYLRKT
ncbi:uncharacterized protein AFUA_3G09870 [Aspergillus fumigatus Af293]|uniref:Uncharacterized protein n=1 Tax=Aspergillus fumigatus (strain ATCC MYA-4609 / CBS 101355 / FGSC A1100 / Af293) TaxID=330879 RepID=Q4WXK9_ASPFU|nr:hypothetical protein AFUA_3G09870 [Aspergillus fumigatus Af293]EAL92594.1 hypothetical protein AFUA_3G09870 [Aspergillus fumigatus Af293]